MLTGFESWTATERQSYKSRGHKVKCTYAATSCMQTKLCLKSMNVLMAWGRNEARYLSVVHSVRQRQKPDGSSWSWQHRGRRYFLQSTDSEKTVSGSMPSVYFIRWWLCMSAHSVISLEGYKAFKTHPHDGWITEIKEWWGSHHNWAQKDILFVQWYDAVPCTLLNVTL